MPTGANRCRHPYLRCNDQFTATSNATWPRADGQSIDEARREVVDESRTSALRLRAAGVHADPIALEGDPADEIVPFAAQRGTGTVVVGTRGERG